MAPPGGTRASVTQSVTRRRPRKQTEGGDSEEDVLLDSEDQDAVIAQLAAQHARDTHVGRVALCAVCSAAALAYGFLSSVDFSPHALTVAARSRWMVGLAHASSVAALVGTIRFICTQRQFHAALSAAMAAVPLVCWCTILYANQEYASFNVASVWLPLGPLAVVLLAVHVEAESVRLHRGIEELSDSRYKFKKF
ncbi:hypothetical protein T492DRAFT_1067893 [Pavlovales sp. CCMP2436]|nr:hypothetical protein T492DRAFT_1067893 [Pavlovales sp. CCMP2436]|mmetsp:Transcript_29692/g.68091  ORF Transcript_29692/g.68091 Transcript_29692/m.68091 type:complete len:195 (+) Transcript_29692:197-781(+)